MNQKAKRYLVQAYKTTFWMYKRALDNDAYLTPLGVQSSVFCEWLLTNKYMITCDFGRVLLWASEEKYIEFEDLYFNAVKKYISGTVNIEDVLLTLVKRSETGLKVDIRVSLVKYITEAIRSEIEALQLDTRDKELVIFACKEFDKFGYLPRTIENFRIFSEAESKFSKKKKRESDNSKQIEHLFKFKN